MNISTVQSTSQSLFSSLSQPKGKSVQSGDEFLSHKPMSSTIYSGRDRDRPPMPAEPINRFGGPLPAEQVARGERRPLPAEKVDLFGGLQTAKGNPVRNHNPLPPIEVKLGGGFPLPAEQVIRSTARELIGGRGSGPMPAQYVGATSSTIAHMWASKHRTFVDLSA